MINLQYHLEKNELEKRYMDALFSTKFGQRKKSPTVKKKFDTLKKSYPYSVIFCNLKFKDIVFCTPENLKCIINKIETRIIEQSKTKYKTINKKKEFIYEVISELHPPYRSKR